MNKTLFAVCAVLLPAGVPAIAQSYTGWVERGNCTEIVGYVFDGNNSNSAISVDLYDTARWLATVTANVARPDLATNYPNLGNYNHGFTFNVASGAANLQDGSVHYVYGYVRGTNRQVQLFGGATISCPAGSNAYSYYYADTFNAINASNWYQNGTLNPTPTGLASVSNVNGSLISNTNAVQLPTGYDYEVKLLLDVSGTSSPSQVPLGTFVAYLRASSNAMSGSAPQGTFYSLEVTPKWGANNACAATVVVNKVINNSLTTLYTNNGQGVCYNDIVYRIAIHGTHLVMSVDNKYAWSGSDSDISSGFPGVGVLGTGSGGSIYSASFGRIDSIPPASISSLQSFQSSVTPTSVSFRFPGVADDPSGVGIAYYAYLKDGNIFNYDLGPTPELYDGSLNPGESHRYDFVACDLHNNCQTLDLNSNGQPAGILITTPISGVDPRRVGLRPTGAYWGAAPEQIDVLSGNLNFTIPLLRAQARGGWSVPFNLTYNSQNWRRDPGPTYGTWNLGINTGYGYAWKLMAGSIVPFFTAPYYLHHYVFTDATGAEYRLDHQNGAIWSSTESVYIWFDASANILHFRDGSFWVMGCTSSGEEWDAGTMYPTVIEDTNGNQILIRYDSGNGLGTWADTSGRITEIEDVRAQLQGNNAYVTYSIGYNPDHTISQIQNHIFTAEGYTFSPLDSSQGLSDPFSGNPFPGAGFLTTVTVTGIGLTYHFSYDNSGELSQVTLPNGGYIKWSYGTVTYSSSLTQREVQSRTLSKDGTTSSEKAYILSHESNTYQFPIHQSATLDDPGGIGEKYWLFNTTGTYIGLVSQYQGRDRFYAPTRTLTQNDFTWAQDVTGNSFINSTVTTADIGQTYQIQKKTVQRLDVYGNVTGVDYYDWGNLSTIKRTDAFTYSYQNNSAHAQRFIYNRLATGPANTAISYDETNLVNPSIPREWDLSYGSVTARGNPTSIRGPSETDTVLYDTTGNPASITANGVTTSLSTTSVTNFAAPEALKVGSLTTTNQYSAFLGLMNETAPNNESIGIGYDSFARPTSTTSLFGAVTTTAYHDTASPPNTCTYTPEGTGNVRWTQKNLDGLGRVVFTSSGYGPSSAPCTGTTLSQAETIYDSCGCSPLGKMTQQTVPHDPSIAANAAAVTVYTYDGIGRTLSVQAKGQLQPDGQPDTQGTTTYLYQGNTVTVTDPAGKWKKFTTDTFGNLVQVNEPNPADGSDCVTAYTYDMLKHLTGVSMPRPCGSPTTTQTRTFDYGTPPTNFLQSATNPENGTVAYTYNSYGKVQTRTDAKNQQVVYTYDTYARLKKIQRYPTAGGQEDTCQQENYWYGDETNQPTPGYSQNALGRLSAIQYYGGNVSAVDPFNACGTTFTESYTYGTNAGSNVSPPGVTGKQLTVQRIVYSPGCNCNQAVTATLNGTFVYDNEGRMTTIQYPSSTNFNGTTISTTPGPNLTFGYDSMGRPSTVTDLGTTLAIIQSATYGAAGQLTGLSGGIGGWGGESRSYNSLVQLTRITNTSLSYMYHYPTTGNNGKIDYEIQSPNGEQINYTYDSLNRLASAYTSDNPNVTQWGQSFTYDGFGNLTNLGVIKGMAPMLGVNYDPSTNHGGCADANGNTGSTAACGIGSPNVAKFDIENRMLAYYPRGTCCTAAGVYSYAPGNKRVWRGTGTDNTGCFERKQLRH